ncbi:hypothetical protein D3C84_1001550 [compost metagenome]
MAGGDDIGHEKEIAVNHPDARRSRLRRCQPSGRLGIGVLDDGVGLVDDQCRRCPVIDQGRHFSGRVKRQEGRATLLLCVQVEPACGVGDARLFQGNRCPQAVAGVRAVQFDLIVHGSLLLLGHASSHRTLPMMSV